MHLNRLIAVFLASTVALIALWLLSLPPGASAADFWQIRRMMIYLTGILAIGYMSFALILAARPVQIEPALGGLDRFYRLHKWYGIGAALFALTHWLLENAPRQMARRGWLERPRRSSAAMTEGSSWTDALRELREPATELGEWGFYLLLILVAIALWKTFPYRYFFKAHRLMAPTYLMLVFHSVVLMDRSYWSEPLGFSMAVLMLAGSAAAVASLFGRIGKSRRAYGTVQSLNYNNENTVLDVEVQLATAWQGHHAGQFTFVDFGGGEGHHPFTISSAWHGDGRMMFSIKGLGDYTKKLPEQLFPGHPVTIEGPYGRFDFHGARPRQIWIAGGIGITPFMARLQDLADTGNTCQIDLIYSTNAPSQEFIENIEQLARRTSVRFHLVLSSREGKLSLDRLEKMVPDWMAADIWFCGPEPFAQALSGEMETRGFPLRRFHHELFGFR
ncbi:ferric reductase-like transmembrane domain-containing protein [Oxalobacteraceae bacterium R-40]|uniref:Ferric reductase-like transmembrane domain-containing protein n=1 Tax=Keguizhuia sedimenti TaxID=3064264 RepID=A0ABU1BTI3_9BURK|nr:ferric reductase-like transmembrane domain-containing protein [Oxalobacteraceae bacterium R-40]